MSIYFPPPLYFRGAYKAWRKVFFWRAKTLQSEGCQNVAAFTTYSTTTVLLVVLQAWGESYDPHTQVEHPRPGAHGQYRQHSMLAAVGQAATAASGLTGSVLQPPPSTLLLRTPFHQAKRTDAGKSSCRAGWAQNQWTDPFYRIFSRWGGLGDKEMMDEGHRGVWGGHSPRGRHMKWRTSACLSDFGGSPKYK